MPNGSKYPLTLLVSGFALSPSLISDCSLLFSFFFFFNDPATPDIYPLPLHDALPISLSQSPAQSFSTLCSGTESGINRIVPHRSSALGVDPPRSQPEAELLPSKDKFQLKELPRTNPHRSEEHTSELQSPCNLVCRLLL